MTVCNYFEKPECYANVVNLILSLLTCYLKFHRAFYLKSDKLKAIGTTGFLNCGFFFMQYFAFVYGSV